MQTDVFAHKQMKLPLQSVQILRNGLVFRLSTEVSLGLAAISFEYRYGQSHQ